MNNLQLVPSLMITAVLATSALAQGPLTPPGSPAETMKSLDQIYTAADQAETRTPISQTDIPLDIYFPGSYYLTENIQVPMDTTAIVIRSANVTLDLNGFQVMGPGKEVGTEGDGIAITSDSNHCVIKNGLVTGFRASGIPASFANYVRYENLNVSENGGTGILAGAHATLENCSAHSNGENGMITENSATFQNCKAGNNGDTGINAGNYSIISQCTSDDNLIGYITGSHSTISVSTANSNTSDGFRVNGNIQGCTGTDNGVTGIQTYGNGNTVLRCESINNGEYGIRALSSDTTIAQCLVKDNEIHGIYGEESGYLIESNNVSNNGQNGIHMSGSATIRDNHVNGHTPGAAIWVGGNCVVIGNTVTNNNVGLLSINSTSYFQQNYLRQNTTQEALGGSTEGAGDLANVTF